MTTTKKELGHLGVVLTVSVPVNYEYRSSPIFARIHSKVFLVSCLTGLGTILGRIPGEGHFWALRPSWLLGTLHDRELLGLPKLRDGVI